MLDSTMLCISFGSWFQICSNQFPPPHPHQQNPLSKASIQPVLLRPWGIPGESHLHHLPPPQHVVPSSSAQQAANHRRSGGPQEVRGWLTGSSLQCCLESAWDRHREEGEGQSVRRGAETCLQRPQLPHHCLWPSRASTGHHHACLREAEDMGLVVLPDRVQACLGLGNSYSPP